MQVVVSVWKLCVCVCVLLGIDDSLRLCHTCSNGTPQVFTPGVFRMWSSELWYCVALLEGTVTTEERAVFVCTAEEWLLSNTKDEDLPRCICTHQGYIREYVAKLRPRCWPEETTKCYKISLVQWLINILNVKVKSYGRHPEVLNNIKEIKYVTIYIFIFVNMPHRIHKCINTLYDYAIINY